MTRLLRIKMAVAGVLGRHCALCQMYGWWPWNDGSWAATSDRQRLQVGHPKGRKWSIRKLNQQTRWNRYLRETLAGKVQAECGPCNRKHVGGLRYVKKDKTRQGKRRDRQISQAVEAAAVKNSHAFWKNQG